MKIAYIVNGFPSISEKFLINQITGLLQAGVDVTIIAARRGDAQRVHDSVRRHGLLEKTVFLGAVDNVRQRLRAVVGAGLMLLLLRPLVLVRALRRSRYTTGVRTGKTVLLAWRLFRAGMWRRNQFDWAHCQFGPNGMLGAFLKDSRIVPRMMITFHGSDINTYPRRFGDSVYRYAYAAADCISTNTSFTAGKVRANGADAQKIVVLPVGLWAQEYPAVAYTDRWPKSILTVGRLVEKKGYLFMIQALGEAAQQGQQFFWHIVGSGPLRSQIEQAAESAGILERIIFYGQLSNTEVNKLYTSCSLFVLASVTAPSGDMEGQGLVLQEAQASGLPVVSTLHNGIPDGVLEGTSGFLVPEHDVQALADRLVLLLNDVERAEQMGTAGREFVQKTYDIPQLTRRLIEIYEQAESKRGKYTE